MLEQRIISKEPVRKGWSIDKKYCITTDGGEKFLLRITPEVKSAYREEMFRRMEQLEALGVPMCRPVKFGKCEEGVYTIFTWIDGKDAEEIIPTLPEAMQYEYGLEAGRILKTIHSLPAPENQLDWAVKFNRKTDLKIKMYNECPIKFDGSEYVIDYIESNRSLLANRPQSFHHGDYHIGNMMIEKDKLIIIDFDRFDYGDPWEEFNRIVWCAQISPLFASGIVNAYFDHEVPLDFWKLLAFYISSNMLSSIPWAYQFGETEVNTMLNQAEEVLSWYNNMQNVVPTWYIK